MAAVSLTLQKEKQRLKGIDYMWDSKPSLADSKAQLFPLHHVASKILIYYFAIDHLPFTVFLNITNKFLKEISKFDITHYH